MKNQKGFTLIELLVVIAIIGIIASIVVASVGGLGSASKKSEEQTVNDIQKNIVSNVPIPQISTSQERINVAKRAELFNSEDKISYIYLVNYGKVMAFYSVKGKVSSLQSYMAPMQKIIRADGSSCSEYGSPSSCFTVDAPDIDGTYGENVDGIFFFTTEGAYVEWRGDYMMSDQPLKLTTQPELVREIR